MKRMLVIMLALVLISLPMTASAQSIQPVILGSTYTLPAGIESAVLQQLTNNPPQHLTGNYVVTYLERRGPESWFVSVAATTASAPGDFAITENMVWAGTLIITQTGPDQWNGEYIAHHAGKVMASLAQNGGGASITLPFQPGSNAVFGIAGVHGQSESWGVTGMVFVDLVGGANLGSNVMSDAVYAAEGGTIDFLCKDDKNVAVRIVGTKETMLYDHILDNSNLTMSHSFSTGELMGTLRHGTFTGTVPVTCGGASQGANNYHVHWGFVPKNGQFQAGQWVLNVSKEEWSDATTTVHPGQWITNSGDYIPAGTGGDDVPTGTISSPNFWDMTITGLYAVTRGILGVLPEHTANGIAVAMIQGVGIVLRIFYTIADTVLDLTVAFIVFGAILILEGLRLFMVTLRFFKKYIPVM